VGELRRITLYTDVYEDYESLLEGDRGYLAAEMFWEVLGGFTQEQLGQYLQFISGSKRVNRNSFSHTINFDYSGKILPIAHTCNQILDLGVYESAQELRERLLYSMAHSKSFLEGGFSENKRIHEDYGLHN
jgi:hypothetical protein